ncbi:amidohydrolase [Paenisporosarcina antarctica]|uniref:Amidohydrolase n=1 Tax=Paenisporosarcina antarctica TaxID=417367 RepID=A0A4P6ZWH7_9BACL|nr:amidohydrolase [Paenisporosarcina antarctica]QBP40603.1 amidohydrolase [Paenisporosarcina antarctica]
MTKICFHHATFYTMKNSVDTIEAILVENGKIIKIGLFEDLKNLAEELVDLEGSFVYPGFVDSHIHMIGHGDKLRYIDLSTYTSSVEMTKDLQKLLKQHPSGEWFVAEGWNENNFADKKILSRYDLDKLSTSPLMLKRVCRHAVIVNSAALEIAGITKDTPDPNDGVIVRDEMGEPTGYLLDGAKAFVEKHVPEVSITQLVLSLEAAVEDLVSRGFTGVHTEDMSYYGDYPKPLQAFKQVIGNGRKFRVNLLRHHTVIDKMMEEATYDEPWIEPGAMKIFIDGALGGRTALLSKPYADDPTTHGVSIHSQDELNMLVAKARSYGQAIAVHAIGDLGMEMIILAIEKHPVPLGKRDRLIHANVLREDLVIRLQKLNIVLDIQPSFVSSDFPWVKDRLGEARLDWAYAWKKLIKRGIICSGGSDSPIEEVDVRLGLYAAIARKKPGETHDGYQPEEKLSRYEAIALYTIGSAQAISKEHQRGYIDINFDADLTVFDRDLFIGPDEQVLEAQVMKTIIAGDIIFEK